MQNDKITIAPYLFPNIEYHSFLLRIWKAKGSQGRKWFFSLENPKTHEIIGFQDQLSLTNYLTQIIEKKQEG
jgi:hypothetical protein